MFDRFALDRMLQFMYRGDYSLEDSIHGKATEEAQANDQSGTNTDSQVDIESSFASHVFVYAIADCKLLSKL